MIAAMTTKHHSYDKTGQGNCEKCPVSVLEPKRNPRHRGDLAPITTATLLATSAWRAIMVVKAFMSQNVRSGMLDFANAVADEVSPSRPYSH
jgi:hypothetical protein